MHMPSQASRNRFEILRSRSPSCSHGKASRIPSYSGRIHRTKESREARRRRDARRRPHRLNAARILDEQLSRDIDRTLIKANIQRPATASLPSPTPIRPYRALPTPPPARLPQTPPQLPLLNFGGLDLIDDLPPLTPIQLAPTPVVPPPVPSTLNIPKWCPPLPVFTNPNLKLSEFPLFFDLSKLPEPTETSKAGKSYQDLQLWQPPLRSPQPRKHSRFFPPPATPKPSVKLPSTRCRIHASDEGEHTVSPVSVAGLSPEAPIRTQHSASDEAEASAANLWHILTSPERPPQDTVETAYLNSFFYRPAEEHNSAALYDHRAETIGAPVELDDTEIPFVHANSLTGHGNERGSEPAPVSGDNSHTIITPIRDFMFGLNEYVVDHDIEGPVEETLPPLPRSPIPEDTDTGSVIMTPQPLNSLTPDADPIASESDEQYNSEQALFDLKAACGADVDEDIVDVATFLTMCHASNCWCNDCEDNIPELVISEVTDDEAEWAIYSTDAGASTPSEESDWEWEWELESAGSEEGKEIGRPVWDDVPAHRVSSVAHGPW